MPRILGPLLGIQGSHWRSWRRCSLELGTEKTSPGEGSFNHRQARVQHPGLLPRHQPHCTSAPITSRLFFTSSPSKLSGTP